MRYTGVVITDGDRRAYTGLRRPEEIGAAEIRELAERARANNALRAERAKRGKRGKRLAYLLGFTVAG